MSNPSTNSSQTKTPGWIHALGTIALGFLAAALVVNVTASQEQILAGIPATAELEASVPTDIVLSPTGSYSTAEGTLENVPEKSAPITRSSGLTYQMDGYSITLPAYWTSRVTVVRTGDNQLRVYPSAYPSHTLCEVVMQSNWDQVTGGDIGNANLSTAELANGRIACLWAENYTFTIPYAISKGEWYYTTSEAESLIDLTTGGALTLSDCSGNANGNTSSSFASMYYVRDNVRLSTSGSSSEYVLADSDRRYYSNSELEALGNWQLLIARNEIYARHGYRFKRSDLSTYFSQKSWYYPRVSGSDFNDERDLNAYERANTKAILKIEKARKSQYLQ